MKIVTHNDFPLSLQWYLPEIKRLLGYLPSWVETAHLRYERSDDSLASCEVQYEYRSITLNVHPLIIEEDDWEKVLLHELVHCLLAPYTQLACRIVSKAVMEGSKDFIMGELEAAEEAVTEDLSTFFAKLRRGGTDDFRGKKTTNSGTES